MSSADSPVHPPLDTVRRVFDAFAAQGIFAALGGSGLLLAHGLVATVRDWDITVDDDPARVEAALTNAGLSFQGSLGDTVTYDTRWRIIVDGGDHDIDIMIGFAVRTPTGTVAIPAVVDGSWNGMPLASLEAWLVAYRLMERPGKPDLIAHHLKQHGASAPGTERMLREPLPDPIRHELLDLLPDIA
jgi:hypothetical protein